MWFPFLTKQILSGQQKQGNPRWISSDLEVFKITGLCEISAQVSQFLNTVTKTSTGKLTHVEIASPNVIWFLSSPCYCPFFSRLLKVDVGEMNDLLPYFENPKRTDAIDQHTLTIWTSQSSAPSTVEYQNRPCAMDVQEYIPSLGRVHICLAAPPRNPPFVWGPVCTQFTYDDHLIQPMSDFRLQKLNKMVVRNEAWNKPRGSTQLASVWGELANPKWLRPRVLHLDTQCRDPYLTNALQLLPDLEKLVLGLMRPDGLGKKFFSSMVARRVRVPRSGFWLNRGTSWTGLLLSPSGVSARVSSRDQDRLGFDLARSGFFCTTTRVHVYSVTKHIRLHSHDP